MLFPLFVFLELSKRIVTTESFLTFISMEGKWNEIITSDNMKKHYEAAIRDVLRKKVFLEILQNS